VAELTHPVIAALDIPLFAYGGKRDLKKEFPTLFAAKRERGSPSEA